MKRACLSQTGSLLVITLWMVTLLSTFAIAIARYLSVELRVMKYRVALEQAKAMARSGVYVAMARLAHDGAHQDETHDWLGDSDWAFVQADNAESAGAWELRAPKAVAWVEVIDEVRKLNLNTIAESTAARSAVEYLLGSEGAAWIQDYVDQDSADSGNGGKESDDSAAPVYTAKNGPAIRCEELLSIPALAREDLRVRVQDFCDAASTYHASNEKININTVDEEVLEALGLTPGIAALSQLRDPDPRTHAQDTVFKDANTILDQFPDGGWKPVAGSAEADIITGMGVNAQTFTVKSSGEAIIFPNRESSATAAYRIEAIVRKNCDKQKPCIVAWKEG